MKKKELAERLGFRLFESLCKADTELNWNLWGVHSIISESNLFMLDEGKEYIIVTAFDYLSNELGSYCYIKADREWVFDFNTMRL